MAAPKMSVVENPEILIQHNINLLRAAGQSDHVIASTLGLVRGKKYRKWGLVLDDDGAPAEPPLIIRTGLSETQLLEAIAIVANDETPGNRTIRAVAYRLGIGGGTLRDYRAQYHRVEAACQDLISINKERPSRLKKQQAALNTIQEMVDAEGRKEHPQKLRLGALSQKVGYAETWLSVCCSSGNQQAIAIRNQIEAHNKAVDGLL
jgi:hypothetical protein